MAQQSQAIGPYARDVNAALGNLAPFAEDAGELVGVLRRQKAAVQNLVSGTGDVFDALSERDGQLRGMIRELDTVFATTGRRDRELREAFTALPTFEREARRTLRRLDRFSDDTDPLVTQLRPAARELSPTLTGVKALAPDLRGALPRPRPADHRLQARLPGHGAAARRPASRSWGRSTRRSSS